MGIVNVRVPDNLKERMDSLQGLNWSQIIREAIETRISAEERERKDRAKILEAIRAQDRIAETLARRYGKPWNATEVIRYWRERRYSSSTRR